MTNIEAIASALHSLAEAVSETEDILSGIVDHQDGRIQKIRRNVNDCHSILVALQVQSAVSTLERLKGGDEGSTEGEKGVS